MKKITIILPIHQLETEDIGMLVNSVYSIEDFHNDVKVLIVCPERLRVKLESLDFGQKLEIIKLYNISSNTDFVTQVNLGITNCDTQWFSILEIDDEYKKVWLSSMNEYMTAYPDVQVFLPLVKEVNVEGKFLGFMNDSVWAYGFSSKQGVLDNEILLEYQNYQTSGALYKTEVVKENGCLKDNIKLTFGYEFLLRLTNNGVNIMTVPKLGYQHVVMRENSIFWRYKNDPEEKLSEDEAKFWIDAAKKEYYFKNKRDLKYVKK
jgi:hypothetical protein